MSINSSNTFLPPSPVVPQFLLISNITRSRSMVVTVTTANSYVVGQKVYFSVPYSYGMFQANGLAGQITSVDVTNLIFVVNIDSTQFDTFVTPSSGEMPATLSPQGSVNIYNVTTVPFHALNGQVGN